MFVNHSVTGLQPFRQIMDKPQLTGHNLGRVFNFRNGCVRATHFLRYRVKLLNLKLKTWPKQLLGCLPLDITLPRLMLIYYSFIELSEGGQWTKGAKLFCQIVNL
jgi:hypothetical protein